jgi:hypothetical protein
MRQSTRLVVLIAGLIAALCTVYWWNSPKIIPGSGAIERIEVRRASLLVHLRKGATLDEAVRLAVFKGLRPESSHDDAETKLGPSDAYSNDKSGHSIHEFILKDGRLRLHQESYSGDEPGLARWMEFIPRSIDKTGRAVHRHYAR